MPKPPEPSPARDDTPEGFWAVTTFYNPAHFQLKLANYRIFRRHLALPLLAIELSSDEVFELGNSDAERLVQLRNSDILWQKERLINRALEDLPSDCTHVVWVDCDIVFEEPGWAAATRRLLDSFPLVQPMSDVWIMPRGWLPGEPVPPPIYTRRSLPSLIASGMSVDQCLGPGSGDLKRAAGYAWAAEKSLLARHGLYDACIVGGGDRAMCGAAYGSLEETVARFVMNEPRAAHFRQWAAAFHDTVRGNVGGHDGRVFHLWHGTPEDRRYVERHALLHDFDPATDIAIEPSGTWRWATDKADLHNRVREYFWSRREDG